MSRFGFMSKLFGGESRMTRLEAARARRIKKDRAERVKKAKEQAAQQKKAEQSMNIENAINELKNQAGNAYDYVASKVSGAPEAAGGVAADAVKGTGAVAGNFANGFAKGFGVDGTNAINNIKSAYSNMKDVATGKVGVMDSLGRPIGQSGVKQAGILAGTVGSAAYGMSDSDIEDAMGQISDVADELGRDLSKGEIAALLIQNGYDEETIRQIQGMV